MILSCGESLIDFVPQEGGSFQPCPGGSPYNVALAAARLGARAGFLGKISRDFFGDMLLERLKKDGVDTSLVVRTDRLSTLAFVKLPPGGEPRYAFYAENSADASLNPLDIPSQFPPELSCFQFGSISLLEEPQASTIKKLAERLQGKAALAFDPNIRPRMVKDKENFRRELERLVSLSTLVKVSAADLEWLYPGRPPRERAEDWLARGAGVVVMTRGRDGAVLLSPGFQVEEGEYPVKVADTIGAGDTFHGALLAALDQKNLLGPQLAQLLSREEAARALAYGVKASGLNCSRRGMDPPGVEEMELL